MSGVLLILFIAIPVAEIMVILQIGSLLGTVPTIGLIVLTAIAGASLARSQGLAAVRGIQESMMSGQRVGPAIVEAALVLAAGVTLLAPGFLTDLVGLTLLFPPARRVVAGLLIRRFEGRVVSGIAGQPPGTENEPPPPGVIDV